MASNWWLGGAASAAVVSILVACAPAAEVTGASSDRVSTTSFDKNDVVSDAALTDKDALTATQIQAFLDKTPWNTKSVLASYTEDGQSAAQIISTVSQKYGVNPIALLVRVQMEQSLLYKTTAPDTTIKIAFGCGCPHSSICSAKYEGFANQADCAAGTLSRSIVAATTSTGTASGWKKGVAKTTVDKIAVNPANAATAALYTYTPYVGEAGGGDKGVGGASLHKQVWDKVTTNLAYTPGAHASTATATTTATVDAGSDAGPTDDTTDPDDGSDTGDTGDTTATDAGAPTTTTTTKPSASSSAADDASLLEEGSAPPAANNVPLPQSSGSHKSTSSSSSATTTSGSASSDEGDSTSGSSSSSASGDDGTTTSKPVASSGCSSTGHAGGGSGLFAGISVAIVGLLSRRRRR